MREAREGSKRGWFGGEEIGAFSSTECRERGFSPCDRRLNGLSMPGRGMQLGILSFWSDVERPRWGWSVQAPGYISARLLLTPASLIEDVADSTGTPRGRLRGPISTNNSTEAAQRVSRKEPGTN